MKTITIVTPSNIEIEYRLAGPGARLGAFLVDFAVQILLLGVVALTSLWLVDRVILGNRGMPSGLALGVVLVSYFVIQFGYFVLLELTMRGQSIGKRIFGLRVIRDNGLPLELPQSLVRGLLRVTIDMVYVGLFIILFSAKHKRLGDMAAGTLVISEHYGKDFNLISETPAWPEFLPDRLLLTPEERHVAEEWLSRRNLMEDYGAAVGDRLVVFLKSKYQGQNTQTF
jgi:uncharacterized RDD family membrane protein YckC